MMITSRANPVVRKFISLADKKYRKLYGEYLVEGLKPVSECIAAGGEVTRVVCTERHSEKFKDALVVSESVFAAISSERSPQGVIASVKLPDDSPRSPLGNCLLLDRLQDPGNVGTIIRTANAAGFEDIYLVDCADAFSPKAVRASMSGIFFVRAMRCTAHEALEALKDVPIVSADMNGENIFEFTPPEKVCLVIGNEGGGVCQEFARASSYTVSIPMRTSCESLNAAVSAAIAMYAINNRQRKEH